MQLGTATVYINGNPKNIKNTNELLGNLNGVYGVKTGFTNGANRCLVSACKRGDLDIISVVLGADTKAFRSSDSIKVIEYAFNNFKYVNISEIARNKFEEWKNENLNSFEIYRPSSKTPNFNLDLSYEDQDIIIPIKNEDIENISFNIDCIKNIIPPIKSGTILGKLTVNSQEKNLYSRDIILSNDINSKGFFEYFIETLKKCIS